MSVRNLEHMLAPQSAALIGASSRPGSIGAVVARNLRRTDFPGPLYFVNPKGGTVEGEQCYRSIPSLPQAPDVAIIATPPATIPGIIGELGAKGCRAAVVITAGIRGETRQAMLDAAKPHLLRIQGPNCLGLILPPRRLDASFSHVAPRPGRLAFLSQSGALITGIVDWAESRGIGFSHVVSLGDMADVDFGDLLDYLAADTQSRAILLYMESLKSAPKFMSAARRAARVKPVVVIKSGRHASGAKAALSHTGALAGADAAFEAAFRRAGLVRVNELQDLFEAAEILSKVKPLAGDRLGILTNGGGAGVMAADRLADLDLELGDLAPETVVRLDEVLPPTWSRGNPIDIIGDADAERYRAAVEAALDDPGLDALLVMNCPTAINPSTEAAKVVLSVLADRRSSGRPLKPVITSWLGSAAARESRQLFSEAGIPSFDTPSEAIDGFADLVRYHRAQTELMATPPSLPDGIFQPCETGTRVIRDVLASGSRMLTEPEAKALLSAYAIPVVETATVTTPEEARAAAHDIIAKHGAAVLKILSKDITHKSDVGGVRLNLETPKAVEDAARLMLMRTQAGAPGARIDGFTLQPMVRRPHARELILGMSVDPTFGPLLLFGAGGVAVEASRDVAHALPPLDMNLARDLMRQTLVWRLLQGYRDQPAAAIDAIALTLVRLSYLVARHPEIREIDINPLLADETGVVALDARVRVDDEAEQPRVPLAIQPYPSEWERVLSVGEPSMDIRIRPIRPDDERLYDAFFANVSNSDQRLRFFSPKTELSHSFLARLTQIDYAREMAFVALAPAGTELLGVSRFMADPDFEKGEYAVLVRSDLKGRGVGWALMRQLVDYAKSAGLATMYGHVLRENTTMIDMCRSLGFTVSGDPEDSTLVLVTLDVQNA
ncbi:MAG: bifunctional acetate--CoA ligase family protein/GNAT family N-acetyltransferase [Hyphomicrobiaceae bacterium]